MEDSALLTVSALPGTTRIPISALALNPTDLGFNTANTLIVPASINRSIRFLTTDSLKPTVRAISAFDRRPYSWSKPIIRLSVASNLFIFDTLAEIVSSFLKNV